MPTKPRTPCSDARCPNLRPCPVHGYEARRPGPRERGYDAGHEAWRRDVLARDPYCKDPDRRHPDALRPSTHADHIVPVTRGGEWTLANGQGLCASCHSVKTVMRDGGFGR